LGNVLSKSDNENVERKKERLFICEHCNKKFNTKKELKQHLQEEIIKEIMRNAIIKCNCKKVVMNGEEWKNYKFICPVCGKNLVNW